MNPTRRGLITGLASLLAAPAIVRVSSIMPVKPLPSFVLVEPSAEALRRAAGWFEMKQWIEQQMVAYGNCAVEISLRPPELRSVCLPG